MRSHLLFAVVVALSSLGLVKPFSGLLSYMWFGLFRPDYVAFSDGSQRFSAFLAISLILGSWKQVLTNFIASWLTNPLVWLFALLQVPVICSALISDFPTESWLVYEQFGRMFVVSLFIPLLVTSVERMKLLVLVSAFSLGIHGFWQALGGVVSGGHRITHGIGGFMSDNNTFAAGLSMILPFCWFGRELVENRLLKQILLGLWACSIVTIMITHSRGAALAAGAVVILIALYSRRRMLTFAMLAALMLPGLYLVGPSYLDRLKTIETYEEDASAMSRIVHYRIALQLAVKHPILGVGLAQENYFAAAEPFLSDYSFKVRGIVVHNSFLQILVHCGVGAFLCFSTLFCYSTWAMWRSSIRLKASHPGLEIYPRMIMISLIAYIVASMTQPRFTFDFAYQMAMYAAAWTVIEKGLLTQAQALSAQASLYDGQVPEISHAV